MRCDHRDLRVRMRFRAMAVAAFLLGGQLTAGPGAAGDGRETAESHPETLRIGYSLTTLLAVDPGDAEATTNLLVELLAEELGQVVSVETRVFPDLADIAEEARSGRLHIVSVLSQEYLELADRLRLEPAYVPVRNGSVYEEILLLVRRDLAEAGLEGLAGKRVLVSVTRTNALPYLWLDKILLSAQLPPAREFLGSIEEVSSASRAVLPVFFGQADACVTISSAFLTMRTLNPQIGDELVALRTSRPVLMSVLCINERSQIAFLDTARVEIPGLAERPEGRQLLMLFGVERHVPFRAEYLEGIRALLREAEDLRATRSLP